MQMPGIDSVAATSQTPMTGVKLVADFQAVAEGPTPPEDTQMAFNDVGPGYFRTMKTRILAGRGQTAENVPPLSAGTLHVRFARFPGLAHHNYFLRAEPWPPPPKKQARPNR
jgi:hypothetical protein